LVTSILSPGNVFGNNYFVETELNLALQPLALKASDPGERDADIAAPPPPSQPTMQTRSGKRPETRCVSAHDSGLIAFHHHPQESIGRVACVDHF
jgi:hypothetical protein